MTTYRWRVWFGDGTLPRDVTAQTEEAARRTAVRAERLVGARSRRLSAVRAERLFEVGRNAPPITPEQAARLGIVR